MSKVYIPFMPKFKDPMLSGIKIWTSRSRYMGNVGDWFDAFGTTFDIIETRRMVLFNVIVNHWEEEGFESPEDMIETWETIHPVAGYVPDKKVCVHIFKRRV